VTVDANSNSFLMTLLEARALVATIRHTATRGYEIAARGYSSKVTFASQAFKTDEISTVLNSISPFPGTEPPQRGGAPTRPPQGTNGATPAPATDVATINSETNVIVFSSDPSAVLQSLSDAVNTVQQSDEATRILGSIEQTKTDETYARVAGLKQKRAAALRILKEYRGQLEFLANASSGSGTTLDTDRATDLLKNLTDRLVSRVEGLK